MYQLQQNRVCRALSNHRGFTLTELLIVIAIVAALMAFGFSAYTAERPQTKGVQCLNNLRQLSLAWRMYAEDNHDYLPGASDDGYGSAYVATDTGTHVKNNYAWTWSKMDYSSANAYNFDPAADIMLRPLWSYTKSASIYKCPGDTSVVATNGLAVPRIRSYSMNIFLGGIGGSTLSSASWAQYFSVYTKLTDLADSVHSPGPANTFLFIEERQDCINWGSFGTDMTGAATPKSAASPGAYLWDTDLPGASHDRAGGVSFCDGHAEIHKWQGGVNTLPVAQPGYVLSYYGSGTTFPAPYSVDVAWMQNASARPH